MELFDIDRFLFFASSK
ncbi:hypothetical protein VCHENC02_4846, partial [Vibrio harveyi]